MTIKIFDNIQLIIKNIHIRFEENSEFGCGIVLKQITALTTDQRWDKKFIDRTLPENRDISVFKLINIDDLFIYW